MAQTKGTMRWAANFAAISAALHVLAIITSSASTEAVRLLPFGIVYAGLAIGLLQGWRWAGYIAFIVLFIGAIFAISNFWALGAIPSWVYIGIAVANLLSVAALLVALWSKPRTAA